MSTNYAIELSNINKSFGRVRANSNVSLQIEAGTIHGIIGENGAGKSTLMSILYGFYQADSGRIAINGVETAIKSPADSIKAGIGMVFQHFMFVDTFTVLENVVLGMESSALLQPSLAAARRSLSQIAEDYGLGMDLDAITAELSVGRQQRIEILKALYRQAKILILDEPTGVLTPQEAEQLFEILRTLRQQGTTVVLITHKLREILAITDNVSVMRAGQMVAHRQTSATSKEELAELMVGRKVLLNVDKQPAQPGEVVLEAQDLHWRDSSGIERLRSVSFQLRAGEILGLAGVSGNGQSELFDLLSGMQALQAGTLRLLGQNLPPEQINPTDMRRSALAHVPEDRQRMGQVGEFSAATNSILGYHSDPAACRRGWLRLESIDTSCQQLMQQYDVRPQDSKLAAINFSGGNQQKLIIAREFSRQPKIMLVGQPTRGVDIGAIEFIHKKLIQLRDQGCAIILLSVELDELMSLSDRILVMFAGSIVGEFAGGEVDAKTLGLYMANAHKSESAA